MRLTERAATNRIERVGGIHTNGIPNSTDISVFTKISSMNILTKRLERERSISK